MRFFGEAANFKCFQVRIHCSNSLYLRYRSRENFNSVVVSSNVYCKSKILLDHLCSLTILTLTHLGVFPLWFLQLRPVACQWKQFETDEEEEAYGCVDFFDLKPYLICIAALTIVLDFLILALPCPAIWRLHLPKRQKIGILVIISAGMVYETLPTTMTTKGCLLMIRAVSP